MTVHFVTKGCRLNIHESAVMRHMARDAGFQQECVVINSFAVNVGNPHVVFMCDAVPSDDQVNRWGKQCEHHPLFPERVNVSFVHFQDDGALRLRVWERGAGMTLACGTAAAASVVAARLRQKTDRRATIIMDGGTVRGEWLADDHVTIEGTSRLVFRGCWQGQQI